VRSDPDVLAAVQGAIRHMDTWLSLGKGLSILFSGLSYAGGVVTDGVGCRSCSA